MRFVALIPLLAVLAGCATEQERCLARATSELRVVEGLIGETRTNLARGYAIERYRDVVRRTAFCPVRNKDGDIVRVICTDRDVVIRKRPRAIDPVSERNKLRGLTSRRAELRRQASREVAACRARYPDA